jgi:hypothetical protein
MSVDPSFLRSAGTESALLKGHCANLPMRQRTPQRELGNLTALHWLMKGKLEEISDHVSIMVEFRPD